MKLYQSFTCILVFWELCFVSQEQGVEVCEQLYLATLLQLMFAKIKEQEFGRTVRDRLYFESG